MDLLLVLFFLGLLVYLAIRRINRLGAEALANEEVKKRTQEMIEELHEVGVPRWKLALESPDSIQDVRSRFAGPDASAGDPSDYAPEQDQALQKLLAGDLRDPQATSVFKKVGERAAPGGTRRRVV